MGQLEKEANALEAHLRSFKWDLFLTITFRKETSYITAVKKLKYFFKRLNTKETFFFNRYVCTYVFFEENPGRRGVHIHCLLRGINPSSAYLLERKCLEFFGNSQVRPYDEEDNAAKYLAKKYGSKYLRGFDLIKISAKYAMFNYIRPTYRIGNQIVRMSGEGRWLVKL